MRLGGRIPVTWQRILESTDWARASAERQGCAWLARGPRARSRCGVAPGLDREARAGRGVALVIMGRALDAGSPFQDNGFSNRSKGHAPAGSGPGDHGACGRARMPGEVRGQRGGVAGGCWVIMRRALGGRIPVTQQRIPESAAARCSWGVRPTRLGAAGFAGGCRRDAPADHRTCARGPDTPCAANGFPNWCRPVRGGGRPGDHGACVQGQMPVTWQRILDRPLGHAPAGGRVRMAAARSAGSPRCAAAPGL